MSPLSVLQRTLVALREDFPYALRSLARSPGLTLTIIITFALGVGANAAVFTVLDRVFFAPPPGVRSPDQLRRLYARRISVDARDAGFNNRIGPFLTTHDVIDLSKSTKGHAQVEGDYLYRRGRTKPDNQPVLVTYVTPGYFSMLGIRMQRGRPIVQNEFTVPGSPAPVTVISDKYWRTHFGSDPNVIGQTINMDNDTYTIVGVVAPEFEGIELESVDMWSPLSNVEGGDITSIRVILRLTDNTPTQMLDLELSKSYREAHARDDRVAKGSGIETAPIQSARGPALSGVTVQRIPGFTELGLSLLARLGIVGLLVLVIAVANVASLLLMRAVRRRHEIAVRLALGVSHTRLILQLVSESVLLSIVAGFAALVTAALVGGVLRAQLAGHIRWSDTVVSGRVMVMGAVFAIVAGCCAGVAPAFFALHADVASWLRSGTVVRAGSRIRSALLITQAALCMALLASAGTLLMSLNRAEFADRGFSVDRTFMVALPAFNTTSETDLQRVTREIRALPEVETVARSFTGLKEIGFRSKVGLSASDTVGPNANGPWIDFVDEQWARAAGARMIGGHWFDSTNSMQPVAVLNESMARALYHGRPIAGTCIRVREPDGACREVVGVVNDIDWNASEAKQQRVYIPIIQTWTRPPTGLIPNYLVVRTRSDATPGNVQSVRAIIARVAGPSADGANVQRVKDLLEPQLQPWRLAVKLFLILGILGLVAATAGIYGLVSFDVAQRTRELGVRLALGASSRAIVSLMMNAALRVLGYGLLAGTIAAIATGRIMSATLFQTSPYNPVVLVGTAIAVAIVTVVASVVPAWRATRVSPAVALAAE